MGRQAWERRVQYPIPAGPTLMGMGLLHILVYFHPRGTRPLTVDQCNPHALRQCMAQGWKTSKSCANNYFPYALFSNLSFFCEITWLGFIRKEKSPRKMTKTHVTVGSQLVRIS